MAQIEYSLPLATTEEPTPASASQWAIVWQRFRRQRLGMAGLITLGLIALAVIVVPILSPYGYNTPSLALVLAPAGAVDAAGNMHWLGTDQLARDEFTRLFYGGRISLTLALISTLTIVLIGSIIGAIAGFYGGWIDTLLMRFTDFMLALPLLPVYVLMLRLFRPSPLQHIDIPREMFKLGAVFVIFGWMGVARLMRASILALRPQPFVEAAVALGAGDRRVIFRHLLPNALGPLIVAATFAVGDIIIWESVLAYFGQGIEDTIAPSWGNLVTGSENYVGAMTTFNPFEEINGWLLIFPTLFIFATVLSLNYVGDALRHAFDPHRRG